MTSAPLLTGFADEASRDLATQIRATREIGWTALSARMIGAANVHDLSEAEFDAAAGMLEDAGIMVPEFGSLIGSWAKPISSDFEITLGEVERCIPRMKRLGTRLVRVMSYRQELWGDDQHEQERFRRLREVVARFADHGITAAHENCMNWGGFSADHSLRLVEEVPGLALLFDTGNPVFQRDRSAAPPFPWQNSLEFWQIVRPHVVHIHVKDCQNPIADEIEPEYTMPGDGAAQVREILADAFAHGYQGGIAIEPHVATVFHAASEDVDWDQCHRSYVEYGTRMNALIRELLSPASTGDRS